jgi:hypothetical protein
MFDNCYFNNSLGFVPQFKNRLFKLHVLLHKKSKLILIEHNLGPDYVRLIIISTFLVWLGVRLNRNKIFPQKRHLPFVEHNHC